MVLPLQLAEATWPVAAVQRLGRHRGRAYRGGVSALGPAPADPSGALVADSWTRPWLPWSAVKVRTGVPARLLLASAAAIGLVLVARAGRRRPGRGRELAELSLARRRRHADASPTELVFSFTRSSAPTTAHGARARATRSRRTPASRRSATTTSSSSRSRSSRRCRAAGAPCRGGSRDEPADDHRGALRVLRRERPSGHDGAPTQPPPRRPRQHDRADPAAGVTRRRQPGLQRRRRVARPGAVDDRHHDHLRRPRADRRRLAGRSRVRDHRAVLALDVGAGADRDRAVPDRVRRRRHRPVARRGDQPVGVVRPRRRRLAGAGGDRPARPRPRLWLGGDAP